MKSANLVTQPIASIALILTSILAAGCRAAIPPTTAPDITIPHTSTFTPPPPSHTHSPTQLPTITPSSTPSPTPDPYAGITIPDLQARTYGGGNIEIEGMLGVFEEFTRFLISHESDGLRVYGFINLPNGDGPFPVVLVLHGFVTPENYQILAYTTPLADALARAGYFVIHPNYRNHPPSDDGPNPFRVGYAIDVLNLIDLIQELSGRPGLLGHADPKSIGLLGHSMGGGITLRSVTVNPEIKAAVLYGAMSGDERTNYERIMYWTNGEVGEEELKTPEQDLKRISPIHHLSDIQAALSIHHGLADTVVPPEWSTDLCDRLQALKKSVECFDYPGQPHLFYGNGLSLFVERVVDFFDGHLRDQ